MTHHRNNIQWPFIVHNVTDVVGVRIRCALVPALKRNNKEIVLLELEAIKEKWAEIDLSQSDVIKWGNSAII